MTKKLFFCGRAGADNPGAWCRMMDEAEARSMLESRTEVKDALEKAGLTADSRLESFSLDLHPGDGESDSTFYRWGLDDPSFDGDDCYEHEGIRAVVNGKVVHHDVRPSEDSEDDHEGCETCKPA
jgi:hypothetical protein